MKLMQWITKNKLLVAIIIALVFFTIGESTKKEAGVTVSGPVSQVAKFITPAGAFLPFPWNIIVIGVGAVAFLGPSIITSWTNVFSPQPTIPIWVWIIGFVVILFMFRRK